MKTRTSFIVSATFILVIFMVLPTMGASIIHDTVVLHGPHSIKVTSADRQHHYHSNNYCNRRENNHCRFYDNHEVIVVEVSPRRSDFFFEAVNEVEIGETYGPYPVEGYYHEEGFIEDFD